ncbi:spore coat polysaccharide biosynthesis protein SpsF [Humidesulfovibrio mexicanus]|uniref:Spore coat polysaccharide biosynthesis protein SpsF n=1 Tax=Humidesulfovibrio mexicanus TaxID=147047 RepID=A0A239BWP8_9BACT|nr:glycosyltransferase family protein [Humidesulfovibrio mexicanus]SNS11484.1 spore coat polysaccharide biosynthesis protein SpsF [Humidesulfovibrio mexicanus]
MRTVAIIQARTGSTRLPGKVLADLCGRPLLCRVLERVAACPGIEAMVVATTTLPGDEALAPLARQAGADLFRGSADDVLERYALAAREARADVVVRITADDPFKDPGVMAALLDDFASGGADYVSNTITPSYPEGLDTEVFSREALERAHREARKPFEREHVTPHIWMRPQDFRLRNLLAPRDLSGLRLTVDTPADLALARALYAELLRLGRTFFLDDVLALLESRPDILALMPDVPRNLGLTLSMEKS